MRRDPGTGSLFPEPEPARDERPRPDAPLADRVRPRTLDEVLGQDEVLGPGKPLRRAIEEDQLRSLILWGPPGSGKTTLALVIRRLTRAHFESMSAVLSGVKELREVLKAAEERRRREGRRTIVFIDEIHRFNKAQQDALLAHVESGDIVLIGATTENPSFEVISALLSRSRVVVLKPLAEADLVAVLRKALSDVERGLGSLPSDVTDDALAFRSRSPGRTAGARSTSRPCSRPSPARRSSTTGPARSTSTSSAPCTSRSATRTPTRASTGWPACWRPARTRSTSRAGWCASPRRTSASPTPRPWSWPWPPSRPCTSWACPRARSPWPSSWSTSRPRRRATRSTAPTARPCRTP